MQVVQRVEKLFEPEPLSALLATLRCDSLSDLLLSAHVADLILPVTPDGAEAAKSLLLQPLFDPLVDLWALLERRLYSIADAPADGGSEAATHYRCSNILREFAVHYGYILQPVFVGASDVSSMLALLKPLVEIVSAPKKKGVEWPRAAPTSALLLHRLLRQQFDASSASSVALHADQLKQDFDAAYPAFALQTADGKALLAEVLKLSPWMPAELEQGNCVKVQRPEQQISAPVHLFKITKNRRQLASFLQRGLSDFDPAVLGVGQAARAVAGKGAAASAAGATKTGTASASRKQATPSGNAKRAANAQEKRGREPSATKSQGAADASKKARAAPAVASVPRRTQTTAPSAQHDRSRAANKQPAQQARQDRRPAAAETRRAASAAPARGRGDAPGKDRAVPAAQSRPDPGRMWPPRTRGHQEPSSRTARSGAPVATSGASGMRRGRGRLPPHDGFDPAPAEYDSFGVARSRSRDPGYHGQGDMVLDRPGAGMYEHRDARPGAVKEGPVRDAPPPFAYEQHMMAPRESMVSSQDALSLRRSTSGPGTLAGAVQMDRSTRGINAPPPDALYTGRSDAPVQRDARGSGGLYNSRSGMDVYDSYDGMPRRAERSDYAATASESQRSPGVRSTYRAGSVYDSKPAQQPTYPVGRIYDGMGASVVPSGGGAYNSDQGNAQRQQVGAYVSDTRSNANYSAGSNAVLQQPQQQQQQPVLMSGQLYYPVQVSC